MLDVSLYVDHQKYLVELERKACREAAKRFPGIRVLLDEQSRIFGGKHHTTLTAAGKQSLEQDFPIGTFICVSDVHASRTVYGVVTKCLYDQMKAILNQRLDPDAAVHGFVLKKAENEVTFDRYQLALEAMRSESKKRGSIRALLGLGEPQCDELDTIEEQVRGEPALHELNDSQYDAVMHALAAKDAAAIHGPPGTGKTTTVATYVMCEVARGRRVLICAPSNVAVDGLAAKLVGRADGVRLLRTGAPERISASLLPHSPERVLAEVRESMSAKDVSLKKKATAIERKNEDDDDEVLSSPTIIKVRRANLVAKQAISGKSSKDAHKQLPVRKEMVTAPNKDDTEEPKKVQNWKTPEDVLERLAKGKEEVTTCTENGTKLKPLTIGSVFESAQVIATTVAGAGSKDIVGAIDTFGQEFDVVVVDEAGQIPEAGIWTALLRGRKAVLAGDPKQLPPTVVSQQAQKQGLEYSLMDRILKTKRLSAKLVRMLNVQYRMHGTIANWCSVHVYNGKLLTAGAVERRTLHDLPHVTTRHRDVVQPFSFHETAFCMYNEEESENGSFKNIVEVELVKKHVSSLLRRGVKAHEIGVISPYKRQVQAIREAFRDGARRGVEVATVDSFQGREKEVIIISLVRANVDEKIGFLNDERRINVAITRARRAVVVICDSSTVRTSPFIANMLKYVVAHGEHRVIRAWPSLAKRFPHGRTMLHSALCRSQDM